MHEGTKEFGQILLDVADNTADRYWPSGVIGLTVPAALSQGSKKYYTPRHENGLFDRHVVI